MNDLENQDFHGDCRKSCLICLPWKSLKKGRYACSIYYLVIGIALVKLQGRRTKTKKTIWDLVSHL